MIKNSNFKYQIFNVKFLVIIIVVLMLFTSLSTTFAKEASDSGKNASPSSSLIEKLNLLKQEIASKAAKIKTEVNKKIQDRMALGLINSIEATDKINLKTKQYGEQSVLLNEYTVLQNGLVKTKKSNLSFKELKSGEQIVALGDVDDKQNLMARKIIRLENPEISLPSVILGEIKIIEEKTISLKTKQNVQLKIPVSDKTLIKLKNKQATLAQLKPGQEVVIVLKAEDSNIPVARFVNILNQKFSTSEKPQASTASATSSAKKIENKR